VHCLAGMHVLSPIIGLGYYNVIIIIIIILIMIIVLSYFMVIIFLFSCTLVLCAIPISNTYK